MRPAPVSYTHLDMWVGDYLARECGVEIHTSPQQFCLNGKNVFIDHGDNMNIDGQPVLKFLNTCLL